MCYDLSNGCPVEREVFLKNMFCRLKSHLKTELFWVLQQKGLILFTAYPPS